MKTGQVSPFFNVKYVCLVVLTLHSAILGLSMRYVRVKPGEMFLASTAVVMTEIVKLFVCFVLVFLEFDRNLQKTLSVIRSQVIRQPKETFQVSIPSLLFIVQNNLLYVAASNLDAATYQVTYQLKILATAVFSVLLLKRRLLAVQWIALLILLTGVVLVNLSETRENVGASENRLSGFLSAIFASALSAFAGVYFEKIVKRGEISVWVRNIQLSLLSIPLGLLTVFLTDLPIISEKGFFVGYDGFVVYVICLQALGGLIVAIVVKYADNILKCFATALGIILICLGSACLFNFAFSARFIAGVTLVLYSTHLYSQF